MKALLSLLLLLTTSNAFSQVDLPQFLVGTWLSEDGKTYERWDRPSENMMKGCSYMMDNKEVIVTEYIDLVKRKKNIFYIPTVLDQNSGFAIEFKLTSSDSSFVFENQKHDFPKKIIYTEQNQNVINVQVLGANNEGFSYKMFKVNVLEATKLIDHIPTKTDNPNFDPELAEKVGSDDYGMKSYVFVILKTGTNTTTDKAYIDSCFMGHMSNMNVLVEKNQLVVAGPFQQNEKTYRGLFILNVKTVEEAKAILATDPAVNAGLLAYEVYGWYGSAALSEYLDASDKIWKKKF